MAYQSRARRITRDMREPIQGGTKLIPGKFHDVMIAELTIIEDKIRVVFHDGFGNKHVEFIFFQNKKRDDLSSSMKQFIAAMVTDSTDLKNLYDSILNEDFIILTNYTGFSCRIETEYRGEFINIKTIRGSALDKHNGGDFFQSPEANTTHPTGTPGARKRNGTLDLPTIAAGFF